MFDEIIKFLETALGKTIIGLSLFFVLGILAVGFYDDVVCTEEEKAVIYMAMEKGDNWTKLDIIQWKLDQAEMEKIRILGFIEREQQGKCTDSQKVRIQELDQKIGEYKAQKNELLKKLKKGE